MFWFGINYIFRGKEKSTNQKQFEILVEHMDRHRDLAKGYIKQSDARRKAAEVWSKIAQEVNAEGPPVRDVEGWKKVSKIKITHCINLKLYFLRYGMTTSVILKLK